MKSIFRRALVALLVIILVATAWLTWQWNFRSALAFAPERVLLPAAHNPGSLRVTFLGVSSLLFEDGDTAILIDGFFTRPGKATVLAGTIAPDPQRIASALQRAGIERLAAVIVAHSHYDHVMDAPEVARRTGALVVGSESTANVARGWRLAEDRIRITHNGDKLRFGRFQITLTESRHAPTGFTGGRISEPLVPPVHASSYQEGESYSLLIAHDGKSILVQSSAGFAAGALHGQKADIVFLGIGMLGKQGDAFRQDYWRETVATVGARRVIPIHWDDFTLPLDQPLVPLPWPFDDFDASMDFISERAQQDGIDVKFLPAWEKIDPFIE
ncbi:MAG TPA: MBL fold metallo-hydrolase [Noviherbaspirillum sp.]|nr:MBL fold metallo-hydrolase [Noviherbaspirillum sp.]